MPNSPRSLLFSAKAGLTVASLSLASLTFACDYGEPPGLGPLALTSQSPGQALRLTPLARAPQILSAGQYEFRTMTSVASIYASDTKYHLDFHLADARLAIAAGLGSCWDIELAYGQRAIVNANLDGITLGFHRLFGYDNSGQDEAKRDTTQIDFPEYGIHMGEESRGVFARSVELTLTRLIHARNAYQPALATSLMVRNAKLGTGASEREDTDIALGVSLGERLGNNHIYVDITYVWFGIDHFNNLPLTKRQLTGMVAYEWRRGDRFSWIAQYLYSEAVILDMGGLSEPSHELDLGAKWGWSDATVQLALIENIITYNNSPDFGFAFGLNVPF